MKSNQDKCQLLVSRFKQENVCAPFRKVNILESKK